MRALAIMACTECKRRNYTTTKNKQNSPNRLEFKKYCKWCDKHTLHKETRQRLYTPVVQLVERRSPKPKVEGSSPSWRASLGLLLIFKKLGRFYGKKI